MARWGMVIDLDKCAGCQACTAACQMENARLPGENWHDVVFYSDGEYPSGTLHWFPRPCMHCENASCVSVCPTGATYKTEDGIVLVNQDACIGCKFCMIACPYGARFYVEQAQLTQHDVRIAFASDDNKVWAPPYQMPKDRWDAKRGVGSAQRNVVTKCTFCVQRVSQAPKGTADLDPDDPKTRDFTPACVVGCPASARYFGDLDNPESQVSRLIADKHGQRLLDQLGNRPQVYYLSGKAGGIPGTRKARQQAV